MLVNKKAFTLIELLIVIAIMGILIALILPRFEDVRVNANTKVCVGNLRGLANAMSIYEAAQNTSVTWENVKPAANPSALLKWQYLAAEPYCSYEIEEAVANRERYTLVTGSGELPDRATCPNDGDTIGGTVVDHEWP